MDLTQLLAGGGNVAFILVAFIVALSVIVAIHEYGHYIVGRWSGIHAETFSIGFGPVLFSRVDKRGTKWQLAALPFGGYVKFLGDANAASVGGTADVDGFSPRNTMLGAPLWARAATVVAGPLFNFILAVLIFIGFFMWQGRVADPVTFAEAVELPAPYVNELENGDVILTVGGIPWGDEERSTDDLPVTPAVQYEVERDGRILPVLGPDPIPPRVVALTPRGAADEAGLKIGDVITEIDGTQIYAFREIVDAVTSGEGAELDLTVWRAGETLNLQMSPRRVDLPTDEGFETRWLIGVQGGAFFEPMRESFGAWEATKTAFQQLWRTITLSLSSLWNVITGAISSCNITGPVGIAQASGSMAAQGTSSYIEFIAFLSIAVGLINLFPIPVLDGGHLVFHAYEAVVRRKPSDRAVNVLMIAGLSIILSFMLFAILNDLVLCP